ncbi:hypothetical protein LQZ19_14250 [Treponema primitia]|uniref:hypothetical protein n=1 Tax=Treponema primitia TaxID=88058 RepID=UPI00397F204F
MKKLLFCFAILTALAGGAATQTFSVETPVSEKKTLGISLWTGPEWNMNSRTMFSLGGSLGADYAIQPSFAAGIKGVINYNFNEIMVLESEVFFRWYFLRLNPGNIFIQGGLGASLIFADSLLYPKLLGGISGGIRIPFKSGFFLEPGGRLGYPFVFGIGITGGYSF